MSEKSIHRLFLKGAVCLMAATMLSAGQALAQGASEADEATLQEELRYVDMLWQMQMPDIAEDVIAELKKKFPEAGAKLKVKEIQGLLSQGKFDGVQKVIDAIPDKKSAEYWAMTLAKADAYYAFGKYPEADKLYLSFFKTFKKPSAALVSFYRDSAYKYAQMLLYLGKEKEGLDAYRRLFNVPLDEGIRRNVEADMAELELKLARKEKNAKTRDQLLKDAEKLVDKLLWKQDLWFGKAIVMKAHICMLRGDVNGAQELVENYMPQLKIIHDALKQDDPDGSLGQLRMSPMPQCRYLLATLLFNEALEEAKKDKPDDARIKDLLFGARDPGTKKRNGKGAFNHFINVFIRFSESQWASESGERSEQIREFVKERYGTSIRTPVTPEQMTKVRKMQFATARLAFSQNQFKDAIDRYLTVLNQFPESPESVSALGDLIFCHMEDAAKDVDAQLNADTVTGYLSERFCKNKALMKTAGDQLRRVGDHYAEMRRDDKKNEVYALFFRDYPEHYAAPQLVMSFAEREFKAGNYPGAMGYYNQIKQSYTNSTYYYNALDRIAQIYDKEGNQTNEIDALEFYVAQLSKKDRPGHAMAVAKFRLGEAYREYAMGMLKAADTNETLTAEQKQEVQKGAAKWLSKAAASLGHLAKQLKTDSSAYAQNQKERDQNKEFFETSLFLVPVCLVQIKSPDKKIQDRLRLAAIAAFESYVKQCPRGKYAPSALVQVGTLYTVMEDMENSQKAFDRLSKEYPESNEAKNSVPMLAAALINMGLRGEGVAKYRQMFAAGGKYTESQFFAAATALEGAREYDLAIQSYEKVLAMTKDIGMKANSMLGKARGQNAQKKFADAHKTLDTFIKDPKLSRLKQVVDANMLLVDVASEEGKTEKDNETRTLLFNSAIDALKMVRNYTTPKDDKGKNKPYSQWTPEERAHDAELNLMSGEILIRRYEAEKKMGLKDKAEATRGEAIVAFMGRVMSIDPGRQELRPVLERAYHLMIPLMLDHKKYKDAGEYCNTYLQLYPDGRYKTDVNNWLNQAKIGQ